MVLFSAQIACTYLKSFHNDKKTCRSVCWAAWGAYSVFQYWTMASNASHPLFALTVNILLIFLWAAENGGTAWACKTVQRLCNPGGCDTMLIHLEPIPK
jgi:hypothetical protein